MRERTRGRWFALGATALVLTLTGCVADPPPPTVLGEKRGEGMAVVRSSNGVVLSIDRMDQGFNPHLLSDQGVDTDIAASLTLPSAFRPGPDGTLSMDRTFLRSATLLPGEPTTVRYDITAQAQWSDSVPVGAEDFEYLWRQMVSQPGVVDPSGYERIVEVRSGAGGKRVEVVFDSPFPQWKSLFSNILPAHLLKDAPNGFQGGLSSPSALSAGPFMARSTDAGRGEIEFVRNDRYWGTPASLDQIIIRRSVGAPALARSLRLGSGSLALVGRTQAAADVAATVPGFRSRDAMSQSQLELNFNTTSAVGGEISVRKAAAGALNLGLVGRMVSEESTPEISFFPFPASDTTTVPNFRNVDLELVGRELSAAGYHQAGSRWEKDGNTLNLTIGVDPTSETALAAAYSIVDQLRSAGIGAQVWELDQVSLYSDALPHGLVDAVVGWQRTDGDAVLAARSRFGCPQVRTPSATGPTLAQRQATTVTTLVAPSKDTGRTPTATSQLPTTTVTPQRSDEAAPGRASGIAGLCVPEIQQALDQAGTEPEVGLRQAGALVADLSVRLPIVHPRLSFLSDSTVSGFPDASGTARPLTDAEILNTAPMWRRTP